MKKCLVCVCVVSLFAVGCMDDGNGGGASFADVVENADTFQPECATHMDCYDLGHSFCSAGTCIGDPQPDVLPAEDVSTDDSDDVTAEEDVNKEVELLECTSHTECPLGYSCNNGQCMANASPECLKNEDCSTGISCECKQGNWQMCTTHICENYVCMETIMAEECEFGCEGGQCLPEPAECETDSECSYLDSVSCDADWRLTIKGQCYVGNCVANNVSSFLCQYGCASGACLLDPEATLCNSDADCAAMDWLACFNASTMSEHQLTGKCLDGVCEEEVYFYQCNLPCADGCYECWQGADCDDGDACTTDMCGDHECMYKNACECQSDVDCADGNDCTFDSCANGSCKNVAIMNCVQCAENGSCGAVETGCYGNTLVVLDNHCDTIGYCLLDSVVCEFGCDMPKGCKNECENNGNCDDNNICTKDACVEGKCAHENKCLYGEQEDKLKCETDADCAGTEFGDYCVATVGEMSLCQPCLQKLTGDVGCFEGEVCHWGLATVSAGESEYFVSTYTCSECTLDSQCDDDNACTADECDYFGQCQNTFVKGCEVCAADADCDPNQICNSVGVDTEYTWTGQCKAGKCEVLKKECLTACDGEACEKLECESDADCLIGQFCNEDYKCGWDGKELQCQFQCPAGKKFAWVMSAKPDEAIESGTGIFKVSPTTLCLWGKPQFKFNCWDGTNNNDAWSDGGKAIVTCNDENFTVAHDLKYFSQGVMVVTFTDVSCGF